MRKQTHVFVEYRPMPRKKEKKKKKEKKENSKCRPTHNARQTPIRCVVFVFVFVLVAVAVVVVVFVLVDVFHVCCYYIHDESRVGLVDIRSRHQHLATLKPQKAQRWSSARCLQATLYILLIRIHLRLCMGCPNQLARRSTVFSVCHSSFRLPPLSDKVQPSSAV